MLVAGIDEVGRGALAGPIMAVAAIFNRTLIRECPIQGVKDSKKFASREARLTVYRRILNSGHLIDFGLGEASAGEINRLGINKANQLAFERAVMDLSQMPEHIIVDGDKPVEGWPADRQTVLPKADALCWEVGAASILAKVIRDMLMEELHFHHPQYMWIENCGYGTEDHNSALVRLGPSPYHRTKFVQKILLNGRQQSFVFRR